MKWSRPCDIGNHRVHEQLCKKLLWLGKKQKCQSKHLQSVRYVLDNVCCIHLWNLSKLTTSKMTSWYGNPFPIIGLIILWMQTVGYKCGIWNSYCLYHPLWLKANAEYNVRISSIPDFNFSGVANGDKIFQSYQYSFQQMSALVLEIRRRH